MCSSAAAAPKPMKPLLAATSPMPELLNRPWRCTRCCSASEMEMSDAVAGVSQSQPPQAELPEARPDAVHHAATATTSGVQITASYGAGGRMAPMEWKDGRWQRCGQQPSTDAPVATDTPRPLTPVTPPTTPPASAPPIAKTDPEVKTPACGCDKSKHCACDPAKHCACDPSKQCACDPTLADRLKTAEQTIAGLQAELANLHLLATRPSTEGQGQPQTGKDAAVDIPALAKQVVDKLPPFKTQIVDLNGKVLTETETKLGETLKLRLVPIAPRPTQ